MERRFKINDIDVKARAGEHLLDVARRYGFEIPSLCHHEALPPIGACRICLVEVAWGGRRELCTSCNFEVIEGMQVTTDTPAVQHHRAMNLELLLARAPGSARLRELAAQYGVRRTRFGPPATSPLPNCILCELCVRACEQLGNHALTMVGRGDKKRIGLAFNSPSEQCTGCASCASVCPTECIPVKDTAAGRTIWGQTHPLVLCKVCGAPVMTERQRAKAIAKKGLPEEYYDFCESCKQSTASKRFASIVW
ncbi:MAG: (2Fe-2S)-binding protein [Deltaproteobacteria bacterium]|nr:(2Fe-2S)-binding protein [Deltaproteobacteria bacterium]